MGASCRRRPCWEAGPSSFKEGLIRLHLVAYFPPIQADQKSGAAACAAETVCAFTDNAATLAESAVENACEAVRADYIRNNIRSSDDESGYADAEKEGNKMKLKIINYGLMLLNTA